MTPRATLIPLRFLAVYLFLAVITGWLSFYPRPLRGEPAAAFQQQIWERLPDREASAHEGYSLEKVNASRVLFPALMQLPRKLGFPGEKAFALLRLVTIFAAYALFHRYLRLWFSEELAFCGTLFVAATVPLTFNNLLELPTDFPELLLFTLGLWAIHQRRYLLLYPVVVLGTLNRESAAVLPFFLLFTTFDTRHRDWLIPVLLAGLCWLIPLVLLRLWTTGTLQSPHMGSVSHNLPGLLEFVSNPNPYNNYLFWLYLFGAFWVLPFLAWKQQPVFFRRLLLSVPIFLLVYSLGGGYYDEPRELVNLYPLLVPSGLIALFPSALSPEC